MTPTLLSWRKAAMTRMRAQHAQHAPACPARPPLLPPPGALLPLLPARAGVPPGAVPFYLGRPPSLALPGWRAVLVPGGLYKRQPCA